MKSLRISFVSLFLFAFFILIIFNGCSKDSDPLSSQEEHFQAIGLAVLDASGKIVVKILRGETTDTLNAILNTRSEAYFIEFYDRNENLVEPPKSKDQKLTWTIDDPSLVNVYQHEGEEGGYEFHLDGLKTGITKIEFFIEHDGHNDFRSGKITLHVKGSPNTANVVNSFPVDVIGSQR